MSTYKVLENRQLTEETFVLRTQRPDAEIVAGQCFSVGTEKLAINREYSMYSAADDPYVDFLIRRVEEGRVSTALSNLTTGDDVEIGGPYGEFCLKESHITDKKLVLIGSGTGIAPFHSFFLTYPEIDFEILHGVRTEIERYDMDHYPEGTYKAFVSQPRNGVNAQRVTDGLIDRELLKDEIFYLCGNRSMIISCISILREKGIHGDAIFTETFF
jgi:ferredoxin--NADP+ reductase